MMGVYGAGRGEARDEDSGFRMQDSGRSSSAEISNLEAFPES
jgi:hypothetical protein